NSIASRDALEGELDEIRQAGYATSREESEDGVTSVAAAITGPSGTLYGINVSVPAHRMSDGLRVELSDIVRAAAKKLQKLLL
ncbi:IclR family transcriptional regulator C-terminal domain-containing protein, partial [Arthrobacter sp. N199823]